MPSLTLFAIPLRVVPYAITAHRPDLVLSVMPRDETEEPFPQLPPLTRHHWCEIHDCHFAEADLSPLARRRTVSAFRDEYGSSTPHLITGRKTWLLLREIDRLIEEGQQSSKTLIAHCHGGVSRSQAAAYLTLCKILGPGQEERAIDALMSANHYALPNPMLVWQADRLMKRGGAMVAALQRSKDYPSRSQAAGLTIDLKSQSISVDDFFI
ncbi:hypothetical protein AA14337_3054 [Acetobacter malorum DSM 14337]|uniref:Tyrosine specific protein phosphatases domain-containing protein n=1 Tax=Acetobacter malorum DSM 14337 TaxID=1307910 RepID=A0ABQ0PZB8_9PROT|nr:hypothetical protein AA14337_3054 [Acetobacter malorum DSM 14337]